MTIELMRKQFEAWCEVNAKNLCLRHHSERAYHYADTLQAWEIWQAAWNTRAPTADAKDSEAISTSDLASLLSGVYYMDPPYGGDVGLLEQLQRMAKDAARYRFVRAQKGIDISVEDDDGDGNAIYWGGMSPDQLDATIDAAIEQEGGE